MTNPLSKVGHGLEHAVEAIIHETEKACTVGEKLIVILSDAKRLTPQFKDEIAKLVADVEPIGALIAPLVVAGGANVVLDAATIQPVLGHVVQLVRDFLSFLPTIEAEIHVIEGDVRAVPTVTIGPSP